MANTMVFDLNMADSGKSDWGCAALRDSLRKMRLFVVQRNEKRRPPCRVG
jgi:hypothetical protein